MQNSIFKCPICGDEYSSEFIIDLMICNKCSHIYKKEPFIPEETNIDELHTLADPITSIRAYIEENKPDRMGFRFPSLMFDILELKPNDFYKHKYNHYFNQMSLMILMNRCGLIPIKQENNKVARTSYTMLDTEVEK